MKKFLAVYIGTEESGQKKWSGLTEAEIKKRTDEGIRVWGDWVKKHEKAIKDVGSPLGQTRKVDSNGVSKFKNSLTAYTVVEAENIEEAAKMFLNHPHFTIFPGDSVEIVECLPLP